MTISIAGRCAQTGMIGVAISSSSICVAARCAWVQAGAGAVLTQNITNPALGADGLALLASGQTASETLAALLQREAYPEYRQLILLDAHGNSAQHSGAKCLGQHTTAIGQACIAAGNMLANLHVPQAMTQAFAASAGHLAERLLQALLAGQTAGGEVGPLYSAGVLVAHEQAWHVVNLRVDWAEAADPIQRLYAMWQRYQPQMQDYIIRAVSPSVAPSYGVPGDP